MRVSRAEEWAAHFYRAEGILGAWMTTDGATALMSKGRVLLVTEDVAEAAAIGYVLRRSGFDISLSTTDRPELVASLVSHDIAVIDVRAWNSEATAIASRLRALPGWRGPIVAYTDAPDEIGGTGGCDGYLAKPATCNDLVSCIREAIAV